MNPVPQVELEDPVIDAVLDFDGPYLAKGGGRKLADTETVTLNLATTGQAKRA